MISQKQEKFIFNSALRPYSHSVCSLVEDLDVECLRKNLINNLIINVLKNFNCKLLFLFVLYLIDKFFFCQKGGQNIRHTVFILFLLKNLLLTQPN